jgi:hypothetical protein
MCGFTSFSRVTLYDCGWKTKNNLPIALFKKPDEGKKQLGDGRRQMTAQ